MLMGAAGAAGSAGWCLLNEQQGVGQKFQRLGLSWKEPVRGFRMYST